MKKLLILFLLPTVLFSQGLNLDKYKVFLYQTKNINSQGLLQLHPPGLYQSEACLNSGNYYYLDSTIKAFNLTKTEQSLLSKNGFMVTERNSYPTFYHALKDIWTKDLPIFITTDMILQAVHQSYDRILMNLESFYIADELSDVLDGLHSGIGALTRTYKDYPKMKQSINDVDVYLTVARILLNNNNDINPIISVNKPEVLNILKLIENETPDLNCKLFSSTGKQIDFSQFKVRGHYTQSGLGSYFKTMIWLGRIEFYLIAPEPASENPQTPEDIQRQIIDALLLNELCENTNNTHKVEKIDSLLTSLIGESDNVQLRHLTEIMNEAGFNSAADLTDMKNVGIFQGVLKEKPYADQKILSQMIWENPTETEKVKPASSFLLMGQRFILDSYVFSNLVDDKVEDRMLPSSLDVLFVLGNNGAGDLLKSEMNKYKDYPPKLAALRYLTDSYGNDFWNSSYYNGWLNAIRKLNPQKDEERAKLPRFMRTAAWWQEKMNTQLASWAQLRHDNLLYAKQSYTSGNTCSFPDAYLEPAPEFYKVIHSLAKKGIEIFRDLPNFFTLIFFETLADYSKKLLEISEKELVNQPLSDEEISFLKSVYQKDGYDCTGSFLILQGWFFHLLYNNNIPGEKPDYVVADVHTAPTDEGGSMVGWVKHVGTGRVNLIVATVETPDGNSITYSGPVMSFYEHTTANFQRLTDEEWAGMFDNNNTLRPAFVNLYLADKGGDAQKGALVSLPVGVEEIENTMNSDVDYSSFPNPFHNYTNIACKIGNNIENDFIVKIYSISGELVRNIFSGNLFGGNYIFRWDGTDDSGNKMNVGTYIFKIEVSGKTYSGKVILE